MICMPYWGCRVNIEMGACVYADERLNENLCNTIANTVLASNMAKFWPIHDLGPTPNGK